MIASSSMSLTPLDSVTQAQLAHVKLDESWKTALAPFLLSETMAQLRQFLQAEHAQNKTIYPPNHQIFRALNTVPLEKVKVVILGQDPYHGEGQANGLSFSVNRGVDIPPSLRNIYHELATDMGVAKPNHGDLSAWANQGVLLLNSVLTVEEKSPASHSKKGWEAFTDEVISIINDYTQSVVFILWGNYAQKKGSQINTEKHLILKATHPSPLGANRGGFFGCKVFSKTNQYLLEQGLEPVVWQLDA